MDRLVIESILQETERIEFQEIRSGSTATCLLILSSKSGHTPQVISALEALRSMGNEVSLLICQTLTNGVYDLEIQMAQLDEPVRISNKAISAAVLTQLQSNLAQNKQIGLGYSADQGQSSLDLSSLKIKDCVR